MKKQFTNPIDKLSQITIILNLLLLVGCQSISIFAPDLLNPASMSPKVGINPNQKYQEVTKFSTMTFGSSQRSNVVQEQMMEAVKGSESKAIKGIEIYIEDMKFFVLFAAGGQTGVLVKGLVIEIE